MGDLHIEDEKISAAKKKESSKEHRTILLDVIRISYFCISLLIYVLYFIFLDLLDSLYALVIAWILNH